MLKDYYYRTRKFYSDLTENNINIITRHIGDYTNNDYMLLDNGNIYKKVKTTTSVRGYYNESIERIKNPGSRIKKLLKMDIDYLGVEYKYEGTTLEFECKHGTFETEEELKECILKFKVLAMLNSYNISNYIYEIEGDIIYKVLKNQIYKNSDKSRTIFVEFDFKNDKINCQTTLLNKFINNRPLNGPSRTPIYRISTLELNKLGREVE